MPYLTNADLPVSVQNHLPEHAQDIYRQAFNNARVQYGDLEPKRQEEITHRVAWSAVKKRHRKIDGVWVHRA
jgi:cation transport regulator